MKKTQVLVMKAGIIEPRDVLSHLSQAVSGKRASELLHSMAASKDILFWTPHGQLLRNKPIIFCKKNR